MANRHSISIIAENKRFYIRFPYNPDLVKTIKDAIPGARFNRDLLCWVAPFRSYPEVLEFARTNHATFDWGIYAPEDISKQYGGYSGGKPRPKIVRRSGKNKNLVAITFDYHPDLFVATAALPCAHKAKTKKYGLHWVVPMSDAQAILDYAFYHDAIIDSELEGHLEGLAEAQAFNFEASFRVEPANNLLYYYHNDVRAPYDYQRAGIEFALRNKRAIIGEAMGVGKAQPLDEPVLTPKGWSTMGQLLPGDFVIGSNGRATEVIAVHPQGLTDLYLVEFKNGTSARCSGNHLWTLYDPSDRKCTVTTKALYDEDTVTHKADNNRIYSKTLKLVQTNKDGTKNYLLRAPMVEPVHFETAKELPLDGYVLGTLLGDGGLTSGAVMLTTDDDFILNEVVNLCPEITSAPHARKYAYRLNGLKPFLATKLPEILGCRSWEKFIPTQYMTASVEQRLSLLQGLMDTDGSAVSHSSSVEFCSTSKQLVADVRDLVLSLGGQVTKTRSRATSYTYKGEKKQGRVSYRLNFKLPDGKVPFRLPRKVETYITPTKYKAINPVVEIKKLDPVETVCITVAAEDGLYVTAGYNLTHNSSIAISALGTAEAFPALVVLPKSAKYVWDEYELPVWMPDSTRQVLQGETPNQEIDADIVIINYDILWHWKDKLVKAGFKTFIADESHALANPAAKRTKAAKEICESGVDYRWLMTGTALTNRPLELIGQLDVLGILEDQFVNASTFKARYEPERGKAINKRELSNILRYSCYIRRDKDKLSIPIPVVRSFLPVETTESVMDKYRQAEKDILEFLSQQAAKLAEEMGEDPRSAAVRARLRAQGAEAIVRLSQLRRLAGEAKIEGTIEFVEQYLEDNPDEKILLFGYHRENLQAYAKHFNCNIIQGGVSDADRSKAIRGIQEGDDRIVCLQIRAAGEALTLTKASVCIFTEQDWSPMRMLQAEARAARKGQEKTVMVFFTAADDTIDFKLFDTLQSKYETCLAIMDGTDTSSLTYVEKSTESAIIDTLLEKI